MVAIFQVIKVFIIETLPLSKGSKECVSVPYLAGVNGQFNKLSFRCSPMKLVLSGE